MSPFFSIIIPLYNSDETLQQTLNGIEEQTFSDYELVFVDGGSTDDTLHIIDTFTATNVIKILSEPDKGIYDAMNKGIDLSSGKWLYFMGSDDVFYSKEVLAQVAGAILRKDCDLLYGNVIGEQSQIKYADDTAAKVLARGIHHQSIFYKRHLFNYTGKYDPKFKVAADYHLTLKIFFNNNFKTRYTNLNVVFFGEAGLSSNTFDFRFYSYHYRFLATNNAITKIDDPLECLEKSIYCCFQLAKQKHHLGFAWTNIVYYITRAKEIGLGFKIKTLLRMAYWTLRTSS